MFRVAREEIEKINYLWVFLLSFGGHKKLEPCPDWSPLGVEFKFPTSIPVCFIREYPTSSLGIGVGVTIAIAVWPNIFTEGIAISWTYYIAVNKCLLYDTFIEGMRNSCHNTSPISTVFFTSNSSSVLHPFQHCQCLGQDLKTDQLKIDVRSL